MLQQCMIPGTMQWIAEHAVCHVGVASHLSEKQKTKKSRLYNRRKSRSFAKKYRRNEKFVGTIYRFSCGFLLVSSVLHLILYELREHIRTDHRSPASRAAVPGIVWSSYKYVARWERWDLHDRLNRTCFYYSSCSRRVG